MTGPIPLKPLGCTDWGESVLTSETTAADVGIAWVLGVDSISAAIAGTAQVVPNCGTCMFANNQKMIEYCRRTESESMDDVLY